MRFSAITAAAIFGVALFAAAHVSTAWAGDEADYAFDPMRIDLGTTVPAWLAKPMARSLLRDWGEAAGDPFSLLDESARLAFIERMRRIPWVKSLRAELLLPDRFDLDLELRRPVAVARGRHGRLYAFDRDGRRLALGRCHESVVPGEQRVFGLPWVVGAASPDLAPEGLFVDAADVVTAFQEKALPRLRDAVPDSWLPRLLAVDASNAGYAVDRSRAEFSLLVRSRDGRPVRLAWGHATGSPYRVTPAATKARVLALILTEHPGLERLDAADLRYETLWRERLVVHPWR